MVIKRYAVDLLPVLGVRAEMEQILLNLLVNAWHAMPGGGTLTLTTARRDAQAVIALADTGARLIVDSTTICSRWVLLAVPPHTSAQTYYFTTPSGCVPWHSGMGLCSWRSRVKPIREMSVARR